MKPAGRTLFVTAALFCAAIVFIASPAPAAPQNVWEALQQAPVDPCNWGGFYIGFNIGGSFNHFDAHKQFADVDLAQQFYQMLEGDEEGGGDGEGQISGFTTFHIPGHSETDTQTIGGAQTGFNLQFGHFLVGVEGGFQGNGSSVGSQHKEFQENELFLFTLQEFVTADTEFKNLRMVETNWNGTVGGKVGFCWNRFLFYVAGGAAFTDVHFSSMNVADTSFFGFIGDGDGTTHPAVRRVTGGPSQGESFIGAIISRSEHSRGDVLTGYYAGGGTMYQLTNLVSAGFEYRHVGYGDEGENLMNANGPVFPGNGRVDLSADQIAFKVNIIVGPSLFGH